MACERVVFRYALSASGARGRGRPECASGAETSLAAAPLLGNVLLTLLPLAVIALRLGPPRALLALPALALAVLLPLPRAWDALGPYRDWFPLARPWTAVWFVALAAAALASALWRPELARRLLRGRA